MKSSLAVSGNSSSLQASRRELIILILAFLTIYFVWGSTFVAIRIAVERVPPFLAAGLRFSSAGALLYGFTRLRSTAAPTKREWKNLLLLGTLIIALDYSAVFWAEKYLSAGATGILAGTVPLSTVVLEVWVFRQQPFNWGTLAALLIGFLGVLILLSGQGSSALPLVPSLAVLGGVACWAFASVLSRSLQLPASKAVTAGAEMLVGGVELLLFSLLAREFTPIPQFDWQATVALAYLTVAGSLVGFTAFVWLLSRMPASQVSSYAYVNPVVAVALGHWFSGEQVTGRMILGAGIILSSVVFLLRRKSGVASAKVNAVADVEA